MTVETTQFVLDKDGKLIPFTPAWNTEKELEFQMGDMNGIAFEDDEVEEKKVEIKK